MELLPYQLLVHALPGQCWVNATRGAGVGTQCSGVYYDVYPTRHNTQLACITSWIHANPYQDVW